MPSIRKLFTRLALVLVALAAFTAPALAAAPSNDAFANARLVTLGFSETLDTTEATIEEIDAQVNETCPTLGTDASVWYALEGTGSRVLIDARASDYTAVMTVVSGSPGNFTFVTCGAENASFVSEPGVHYTVMVTDAPEGGRGDGGILNIAFIESLMPRITYSVDEQGTLDASSGSATISGSYTCSAGARFAISVTTKQGKVVGEGYSDTPCDGTTQRWTVVVEPQGGRFRFGKLKTTSFGSAYTLDQGSAYELNQKVTLQ
jgi:hypothetical protein